MRSERTARLVTTLVLAVLAVTMTSCRIFVRRDTPTIPTPTATATSQTTAPAGTVTEQRTTTVPGPVVRTTVTSSPTPTR